MNANTDYPPTRAAAKAAGLKHYFTGKPCSKGHTVLRHLTGTCVDCQQLANKAWADRNPGAMQARARAYYQRDPERAKARFTKYRRRMMGIPEAERPKPGRCENCDREPNLLKGMHIDHDHTTGKFRGWLCNVCNRALGMLGDDIAGLERALDYLRRNGSS